MSIAQKIDRWKMTIDSLQVTLKRMDDSNLSRKNLVPVIHGFSEKSLRKVLYDDEVGIFGLTDWDKIALGAQKQLLQKMTFVPTFGKIFCNTVAKLREFVGDERWLHILAAGGEKSLPLIYYLGANSADSNSWYIAAIHGRVTIPVSGAHKLLVPRKKQLLQEMKLSLCDRKYLENCTCEICKTLDSGSQIKMLNDDLYLRLQHNLFVNITHSKLLSQLEKKELGVWIRNTQRSSSLWPVYQYALEHF